MKIGIITSPFGPVPPNAIGAVERLWYYIGKELNDLGLKVTLYSKADNGYNTEKKLEIIPIKGFQRTGNIYTDIILDFIYTLKALFKLKKVDILIQNTFSAPIISKLFKWKYKKSIYNVARKPGKHFKLFWSVDQFSCVSEGVRDDLIPILSDNNKITVVHNPVNLDYFTYSDHIPIGNSITIGYHGRIHPEKGLEILFKAAELLSVRFNIVLKIIGPHEIEKGGGGEQYINELNKLCHNVKIDYVGSVCDPEKLNTLLTECNLYCYPSVADGETFGVSPLEAMATGLPVIVSDLQCFKSFITANENGVIFNHRLNNPHIHLADIIQDLLEHKDKLTVLGQKARERALLFSVRNIANTYLTNFKILLKDEKSSLA